MCKFMKTIYIKNGIEYTTLNKLKESMPNISFPAKLDNDVLKLLEITTKDLEEKTEDDQILLQRAKLNKLNEVEANTNFMLSLITKEYSDLEIYSFSEQQKEAELVLSKTISVENLTDEIINQDHPLSLIYELAKNDNITIEEYANKIIKKVTRARKILTTTLHKEKTYKEKINNALTVDEVEAISIENYIVPFGV